MRGESGSRTRGAWRFAVIAFAGLAVASCASVESIRSPGDDAAADAPQTAADPALAASQGAYRGARTYSGTYSCDGCVERRLTVTIFADGSYRLREVPSRGEPIQEQGRWSVESAAPDRIVLESAGGARAFRRTAPGELTLVDHEGRELHGLTGGVLARLPIVDPLPASERFAGFYRRSGAQRVLVDCASGRTLRVLDDERTRAAGALQRRPQAGPDEARAAAQAALDAAWAELAPRDDETVLVVVHAHRAAPDGATPAVDGEAIVVDAFERATRNGRCGGPLSSTR